MKKLSILITALLITIAASAQITDKTQLPTVTKDQRCIMIDSDGKFDSILSELRTVYPCHSRSWKHTRKSEY